MLEEFKCKKCGNCCSNFLPLTQEDIKRIKKHGNKLKENQFLASVEWYAICPFLNEKKECDIYEDRPDICRAFTCHSFNNKIYNEDFLKSVKTKNFNFTNLREEFFGGK